MRALFNKEKPSEAIMIGNDAEDVKALKFFFEHTWGFHSLWILDDKNPVYPNGDNLMSKVYKTFPDARCIGLLSSPDGYVNKDVPQNNNEEQLELGGDDVGVY